MLPSKLRARKIRQEWPHNEVQIAEPAAPANAGITPRFQADAIGPAWLHSAFGDSMNWHVQNLLWNVSTPFGRRHEGNIVAQVIRAAGSQLSPADYQIVECRFRVFRRMLSHDWVRTMFIVKAQVFDSLQDLMIEIYRGYKQSRHDKSLLFYPDSSMFPVSVIGRGEGYDFIHVVRSAEPGAAPNGAPAASSGNSGSQEGRHR